MKLTQIRDLVAVAERGSLRAAARQLDTAQPAITRSIRDLEHELGVTLLERSTSGVTLTPIGQAFYRRVSVVQHELRKAREEVLQLKGEGTGTVSVGLATAPHVALLPGALRAFQRRFPEVRLNISEGLFPSLESDLRDGRIDFYVGPKAEDRLSGEYNIEKLSDNLRVALGRRGHPLRAAKSLRDLTSARWVSTSVTIESEAELNPVFERAGLPSPVIAVQAHSALTMITVAASSDLLALLPQQWLSFARKTKLLDHIAIAEQLLAPAICIITRARLPLTPVAEHLCDLFRRESMHSAKT